MDTGKVIYEVQGTGVFWLNLSQVYDIVFCKKIRLLDSGAGQSRIELIQKEFTLLSMSRDWKLEDEYIEPGFKKSICRLHESLNASILRRWFTKLFVFFQISVIKKPSPSHAISRTKSIIEFAETNFMCTWASALFVSSFVRDKASNSWMCENPERTFTLLDLKLVIRRGTFWLSNFSYVLAC